MKLRTAKGKRKIDDTLWLQLENGDAGCQPKKENGADLI